MDDRGESKAVNAIRQAKVILIDPPVEPTPAAVGADKEASAHETTDASGGAESNQGTDSLGELVPVPTLEVLVPPAPEQQESGSQANGARSIPKPDFSVNLDSHWGSPMENVVAHLASHAAGKVLVAAVQGIDDIPAALIIVCPVKFRESGTECQYKVAVKPGDKVPMIHADNLVKEPSAILAALEAIDKRFRDGTLEMVAPSNGSSLEVVRYVGSLRRPLPKALSDAESRKKNESIASGLAVGQGLYLHQGSPSRDSEGYQY